LKLQPELNPRNCKQEPSKNKNLLVEAGKEIESNSYVYEKIGCTRIQKEVNLSSLHRKEEKEMTSLFHIKIKINKDKVDALLGSGSQANLIAEDLVSQLGL